MKRWVSALLAVALLCGVIAMATAEGVDLGDDAVVIEAIEIEPEQTDAEPEEAELTLGDDALGEMDFDLAIGLDLADTLTSPEVAAAQDSRPVANDIQSNAVCWNGHYYRLIYADGIESWEAARAYCESLGGYLATITSAEEDAFIYNNVVLEAGYLNAYFGLSDAEENNNWKWVTGEEVVYTNWADGEPNNQGRNESYAMYYFKFRDGKWNDGNWNRDRAPFICEWSDYSGQDSAVDFRIEDGVLVKYLGNSEVVTIPDGVHTIGEAAFYGCGMTQVIVPEGVQAIDSSAFETCYSLANVTLPDSLVNIGSRAFVNCDALPAITIPGGVDSIGNEAFYGCDSLTSAAFSYGLTSIGEDAFARTGIINVMLPDSVTDLGDSAFSKCESLTSITMSNAISRIGDSEFYYCTSLTNINLPAALDSIGDYAFRHTSLTEANLPDTLTNIGDYAYANCDNLKKVVIPSSVTEIGENAFTNSRPTVYCEPGSYAETYAEQNKLPTRNIDEATSAKPTGVAITKGKSATIYVGNKLTLKAKVQPAGAKTKLTWSSSNTRVAAVSKKGVVTPKKAGKAVITVKTANGKRAKINLKVIDARSVRLKEGKSATLRVGKKLTLHAKVAPAKVKPTLKWSSSNKKVATVTGKGVVKAVKPGTAKITVKTGNGKSATITITVKQ